MAAGSVKEASKDLWQPQPSPELEDVSLEIVGVKLVGFFSPKKIVGVVNKIWLFFG